MQLCHNWPGVPYLAWPAVRHTDSDMLTVTNGAGWICKKKILRKRIRTGRIFSNLEWIRIKISITFFGLRYGSYCFLENVQSEWIRIVKFWKIRKRTDAQSVRIKPWLEQQSAAQTMRAGLRDAGRTWIGRQVPVRDWLTCFGFNLTCVSQEWLIFQYQLNIRISTQNLPYRKISRVYCKPIAYVFSQTCFWQHEKIYCFMRILDCRDERHARPSRPFYSLPQSHNGTRAEPEIWKTMVRFRLGVTTF